MANTRARGKHHPKPEPEVVGCAEIRVGWCASQANGRAKCPKGWCSLAAPEGPHAWEPGATDSHGRSVCRACRELWEHPCHEPSRRRA